MQRSDDAIFGFLVEHAPDGVFILLDGRVMYLNPAGQRMFGVTWSRGESLLWADLIDAGDRDRAVRDAALIASGIAGKAMHYRGCRPDGERLDIEVHAAPVRLGGRPGLHGVIRDIHDRRLMEEQLELLERTQVVSRLASGIAHEFNNLLAVIQASADLIDRSASDPAVRGAVQRIRAATARGSEKVRHVSRMAGPLGDDAPRPLYLNPLIEDALEMTRARWSDEADQAGVRYDVSWSPGTPPPVEIAPAELQSALVALIFNAVEAMPEGGKLTLRTAKDEHGGALVEVGDTGEGIPEDVLARVTDPFFTTRRDRSMGLGLALVNSVVKRHDGRVEIESRTGQGTRISLHLPAATRQPTEPPPPPRPWAVSRDPAPTVDEPDRPRTRSGRSVLLIDDQPDLVQVVRTILEARGYDVDTAHNGCDGVALAERSRYSVVLTDLGMPDISGWEVAARVHEAQPDTPVVLMTGWAADIDERRLSEARIEALLPKPFRSEELIRLVERLVPA